MRLCSLSLLAIATLTSAVYAQDAATNPHDDPDKSIREEVEEFYRDLLFEEMARQGANYADEEVVLPGAIKSAEHDGFAEKANFLKDIQAWKEHDGQLARRSIDYGTSESLNSTAIPDDDVPDAADIEWVDQFMAGQPVDNNLLWSTPDLTENNTADSVSATSTMDENDFLAALTRARVLFAIARARFRSNAASDPAAIFSQEDFQWANAFMDGEFIDENMIFNATDLDAPASDNESESHTPTTSATNSTAPSLSVTNSTLEKRHHYKHPPKNALQVLRRAKRAMRRARHRRSRYKHYYKAHHHKPHHKVHHHPSHPSHHNPHHGPKKKQGDGSKPHIPGHHVNWHKFGHAIHGITKHEKHKGNVHHHKKKKQKHRCYTENMYYMCMVPCSQAFYGAGKHVHCVHLSRKPRYSCVGSPHKQFYGEPRKFWCLGGA